VTSRDERGRGVKKWPKNVTSFMDGPLCMKDTYGVLARALKLYKPRVCIAEAAEWFHLRDGQTIKFGRVYAPPTQLKGGPILHSRTIN